MKTRLVPLIAAPAALLFVLAACTPRSESGKGFVMPAGSPGKGRTAFVELKCHECHTVAGVDLPAPTVAADKVVPLGGEVTRLRSYGDLVTAIMHPSQRISELMRAGPEERAKESPMPVVNEKMTVQQLVDLVTFLHPHYKEALPVPQHVY